MNTRQKLQQLDDKIQALQKDLDPNDGAEMLLVIRADIETPRIEKRLLIGDGGPYGVSGKIFVPVDISGEELEALRQQYQAMEPTA
jgi:hypothetical protein